MFAAVTAVLSYLSYIILSAGPAGHFPPPLTAAEEHECFRLMRETGDTAARSKLIEHNLRLVSHIVKKYYSSTGPSEELLSIGTVGLIKAVDSFDSTNGARLGTYASRCIQNEILMYFRARKKLDSEVSINETIDVDRDGNPLTYMDVIKCEDTIAEDIDRRLCAQRALEFIRDRMDERERSVIVLRYGLDREAPLTQRETALRLGISRSYVSRIEKGALERLEEHLSRRT